MEHDSLILYTVGTGPLKKLLWDSNEVSLYLVEILEEVIHVTMSRESLIQFHFQED